MFTEEPAIPSFAYSGEVTDGEVEDYLIVKPVAAVTGIVTGHVYYDRNGDGTQDLDGLDNTPGNADDEVDLADCVDVKVTHSNGAVQTVVTDASGNWTATVPPGSTSANVDETDPQFTAVVPPGWIQTEGTDPSTVTAIANSSVSAGNDGYYAPAAASGYVYIDVNGNGLFDPKTPRVSSG